MMKFSLGLVALALAWAPSAYAAAAPFSCPVKHPVPQALLSDIPAVINTEMDKRFDAVINASGPKGPGKANAEQNKPVDPALMTALAQVAGCGALIDKESSCANYFSPFVGSPLSVFMDMKKTNPLRMQFEAAIKALPDRYQREAAQHCIKLVGGK
jgi:hypothetical protein